VNGPVMQRVTTIYLAREDLAVELNRCESCNFYRLPQTPLSYERTVHYVFLESMLDWYVADEGKPVPIHFGSRASSCPSIYCVAIVCCTSLGEVRCVNVLG
jgi:hypothetical protein